MGCAPEAISTATSPFASTHRMSVSGQKDGAKVTR